VIFTAGWSSGTDISSPLVRPGRPQRADNYRHETSEAVARQADIAAQHHGYVLSEAVGPDVADRSQAGWRGSRNLFVVVHDPAVTGLYEGSGIGDGGALSMDVWDGCCGDGRQDGCAGVVAGPMLAGASGADLYVSGVDVVGARHTYDDDAGPRRGGGGSRWLIAGAKDGHGEHG
jgi:hypothetical protein